MTLQTNDVQSRTDFGSCHTRDRILNICDNLTFLLIVIIVRYLLLYCY